MMLVLQVHRFSSNASTWEPNSASFHTFWCHPHLSDRNALVPLNEHTFPVWDFLHPSSNKACSNCLSHNNPANGWPFKFRSRGTTGSPIFLHDFGHLCREKRSQPSGNSDFGFFQTWTSSNFTWVLADTASLACPAHPGSLEITSRTLAPDMCDAEDPCTVKTSHEPQSFSTTSSRSTTRPSVYFWTCRPIGVFFFSESGTSPWALQNELWCLLSVPARSPLACCWLGSCHAGKFFSFSNYFLTAARIRSLHCLVHWNRFVHKIIMTRIIVPSSAM